LLQAQEAFTFTTFDPFGGDEGLFDDEEDNGGVDGDIDQHDAVEGVHESLASAHTRRLPQQQQTAFSQSDPFGSDEEPEEPEETDDCSIPEGDLARAGLSPPSQTFANYDLFGVDDDLEETA